MLKLIAKNRGVVQLTMLSNYLREAKPNVKRDSALAAFRSNMKAVSEMSVDERDDYREKINLINKQYPDPSANVGHVVDHIDHIVKIAGIDHVGIGCDFDGGGGIDGVYDVSEIKNITVELVRRGYNEAQIEKIWGGNLLRVFKEVQEYAEKTGKSSI